MISVAIASFACKLVVFGVCAYAVFWLGHSGWWFLLALIVSLEFGFSSSKETTTTTKEEPRP